jgi:hypothetical protein
LKKIEYLYAVLEKQLSTGQVNSLAHPNGDNYDIYTAYHEMKNHAMSVTREQLSHEALSRYMVAMKHPGKWHGGLFNVLSHWYEEIKDYLWLNLIGILSTQMLCLMQSAVEDVIMLEYMQQIDHWEHRYRRVSSTYKDALWESNPTCLPHKKWAPDCDLTRQIIPMQVIMILNQLEYW